LLAVSASPLAVTVIVAELTGATEEAVSVSVEEPLSPLSVIGLLLHDAVTPLGNPLTLKLTAPLNVALLVNEIASATVFPCITVAVVEATEIAMDGNGATSTVICLLAVNPSPLPVTVIVADSRFAADVAVNVSVEEPLSPLSATGLLLHDAVTPLGNPLTLRLTAPLYVASPTSEIASVTVFPCTTVRVLEAAPIAMEGAATTCTVICLLAETPSPPAVTVIVAEPAAPEDEAVSVSVEDPLSLLSVIGLLLHDAVTPLGSPLTVKLTAPVYVPLPATEIASDTVFPCTTDNAAEALETVSAGGVSVTVIGTFAFAG
jgi:hypothetical protein